MGEEPIEDGGAVTDKLPFLGVEPNAQEVCLVTKKHICLEQSRSKVHVKKQIFQDENNLQQVFKKL